MVLRFAEMWRWQGTMDRKTYAIAGIAGVLVKFFLDKIAAFFFLQQLWFPWSYWIPLGPSARINALTPPESRFAAFMVMLALPFIWLGVTLTVQRLRDAGQPVWLVVLFFIPVINLLFFALLCAMPSKPLEPRRNEGAPWPAPRALGQFMPRSKMGSALVAILLTSVIGLFFVGAGTEVLRSYGWGLFVALPFCLGLFSVLVYSYHEPRSGGSCMAVAMLSIVLLGGVLLVVAIEGIICILMAAPFAFALAALGGALGYAIQLGYWGNQQTPATPAMMSIVLLFTPSFFGVEHLVKPQAPAFCVRTAIEVNAPPEKVWKQLVAFAEIPQPTEMLFRSGIAYPVRAEISGHGPGAVRHCVFSTGAFVEPIEIWDEPRLLKFSVTDNPPPLRELTPYAHIEPPHLHGYFVSHEGQFLLTALPGGRTRLEGTTWYSNAIWPAAYWHLWSDYIIHRIHYRVLEHIRADAERN